MLELAPSTLSRIETGQAPVRVAYLTALLDLYGVHDQARRAQLADLARDGWAGSWHDGYGDLLSRDASRYLDLATAATPHREYAVHAVPGLAQTLGYAVAAIRAVRPRPQVRDLVALQRRRQEQTRSAGYRLHLILDQSALLRLIGTAEIVAEQLRHLLSVATDPAVTLQVAELARPRPVIAPPFTILSFPGPAGPDAACTAGIRGQITISNRPADLRTLQATFTTLADDAATTDDTATLIKDTTAHWDRLAHQDC